MAEEWKTEYHVIGDDGQAFAWEDDLAAAVATPGVVRVDEVIYYHNDVRTVWPRDPDDD